MVGKCFAGFVVTFWLVTMGALVRMEFFPAPSPINSVSSEKVLRKIFSNPELNSLHVYYKETYIGDCHVDITSMADAKATVTTAAGQPAESYLVTSTLNLTLSVFGTTSQMKLKGVSVFNPSYNIQKFSIRTTIADARVDIHGDRADGKVNVQFEMGDLVEKREFDFNQIDGAGMASALGLPGLANFSFLGGGGIPTGFGRAGSDGVPPAQATTRTYVDPLTVGNGTVPAYLIELRLDEAMWAKMWVDDFGTILLVQTSMGLMMEADTLDTAGKFVERTRTRHRRGRTEPFIQ